MSTLGAHSDLIGQVVDGRYRILKVIGRGGMGIVYQAEQVRLARRPCAVKVLLPEYTRNDTVRLRFEREAETAARVKHPNVVEILDTGTIQGGSGYIAMELLVGEPLDAFLRREGPLPWSRARNLILQICRALAAAHAQGVVHRDVKPQNCFRSTVNDDPDVIKVLDFGIAKLTDSDDVALPRLTDTDTVLGTYAYMALEQIQGKAIDHRVDIWAAGVILYEMLTGRPPFRGQNPLQLSLAIAQHDPTPMSHVIPSLPDGLDAIVEQALAKDRDLRFSTIDAFVRAFAAIPGDSLTVLATGVTAPAPAQASDTRVETVLPSQVSIDGLTVIAPEDVQPITHETTHSVVTPSTHPGHDEGSPPALQAMQTEIAPVLHISAPAALDPSAALYPSAVLVPALSNTPSRRPVLWLVLVLPLLTVAAIAILLIPAKDTPPTADPDAIQPDPTPITVKQLEPTPEPTPLPDGSLGPRQLDLSSAPPQVRPPEPIIPPPAETLRIKNAKRKLESRSPEPSTQVQPVPELPAETEPPPILVSISDPEAGIRARARKCRKAHNAVDGTPITVEYSVESDGTVASAKASIRGALGECLAKAVQDAQFDPQIKKHEEITL